MENRNVLEELNELIGGNRRSFKDYLNLLRTHRKLIIFITVLVFAISVVYAYTTRDIYQSKTVMKILPPKGSILTGNIFDEINNKQDDRYIANEIELLKSYSIRKYVAETLIDSFNNSTDTADFFLILNKDYFNNERPTLKKREMLVALFSKTVNIEQKRGLDFLEITVASPSPKEAYLMANAYADVYREYNLQENRRQVSHVTRFLEKQKSEKHKMLADAEDSLKYYKLRTGLTELDKQSSSLIDIIADFESKKNAAEIELSISTEKLFIYKEQLKKRDPSLSNYMESKSAEPYLNMLQQQIAQLETQRDLALTGAEKNTANNKALVEYNQKINELKAKLQTQAAEYQTKVLAASPDEIKELTKDIFTEEININSLKASVSNLSSILSEYESKFNTLPEATLILARLERNRAFHENLYSLLEEKYQEAMINEQSIPGNVIIIDKARIPNSPSSPNRRMLLILGLIAGIAASIAVVILIDYLDDRVKSPEDIQRKKLNVLTWIPKILTEDGETEVIVKDSPRSIPAESYRTLRTKVQYAKSISGDKVKTILITSAGPGEGKTITSVNLAASFAHFNKKVLLIDCDLRKPKVHTLFKGDKAPGFTDYFLRKMNLIEIVRETEIKGLDYIAAGSITHNPSEILGAPQIELFLNRLKENYDIIIIDSAPLIPVTDTEIISKIVDASVLIIRSKSTKFAMMEKAAEILGNEGDKFLGTILNNFNYKDGYGAYYKYYYYYSHSNNGNGKPRKKRVGIS